MIRLKLIKSKSYWGIVKASEDKPFAEVDTKEKAEHLVGTGYFDYADGTEVEEDAEKVSETSADVAEEIEEKEEKTQEGSFNFLKLQQMSKAELVEYAGRNGIDITGCKTKDDISSRIVAMMAKAAASREALREQ